MELEQMNSHERLSERLSFIAKLFAKLNGDEAECITDNFGLILSDPDHERNALDMLEDLLRAYIKASEAKRAGLDQACKIFTGFSVPGLVIKLLSEE